MFRLTARPVSTAQSSGRAASLMGTPSHALAGGGIQGQRSDASGDIPERWPRELFSVSGITFIF